MSAKIKWKVANKPDGRYASFSRRVWPTAHYVTPGEDAAVQILCEDDYHPRDVKTGNHGELTIWVADHSAKPVWKWRAIKRRAKTLVEAKEIVAKFLTEFPYFAPGGVAPVQDTTPGALGRPVEVIA